MATPWEDRKRKWADGTWPMGSALAWWSKMVWVSGLELTAAAKA
jgi:hypothetical protein